MLVREIMSANVEFIAPYTSLKDAAMKMRNSDIGVLPVGEDEKLVGMVTDRDITVRGVANGRDPEQTKVSDVMSDEVFYLFDDQTLEDAEKSMSELQVRRLPVVNREKRLVGLLSIGDMASTSNGIRPAAEALADVSKPS